MFKFLLIQGLDFEDFMICDLCTLEDGKWLNDNIIDGYMSFIHKFEMKFLFIHTYSGLIKIRFN